MKTIHTDLTILYHNLFDVMIKTKNEKLKTEIHNILYGNTNLTFMVLNLEDYAEVSEIFIDLQFIYNELYKLKRMGQNRLKYVLDGNENFRTILNKILQFVPPSERI